MEYRKILLALMIAMEGTLCASAQNLLGSEMRKAIVWGDTMAFDVFCVFK